MLKLKLIAIDIGGWDPPLCLTNLRESQRISAVQNVKQAIRTSSDLGCPLITSHLWGLPQNINLYNKSWYYESFKASISEVAPLLEERKVRLNFMPHTGGFIEESNAPIDIIKETECENIGYTY